MLQPQSEAAGPGLPQVLLVPTLEKAEDDGVQMAAAASSAHTQEALTFWLSLSSIPSGTPVYWALLPILRVGLPSSGTLLPVRHLWELPRRHTQRFAQ